MNHKDYLSIGILEACVINKLTVKEPSQVTRLAELHPEIRKEISQIEANFQYRFTISNKTLKEMKNVPDDQAFAINIKPAEGSQLPTSDQLIIPGSTT